MPFIWVGKGKWGRRVGMGTLSSKGANPVTILDCCNRARLVVGIYGGAVLGQKKGVANL